MTKGATRWRKKNSKQWKVRPESCMKGEAGCKFMTSQTISNVIAITDPPPEVAAEIRRRLTMPNPKWIENNRMNRWNGNTEHEIKLYKCVGNTITMPRGFIRHLIGIFHNHKMNVKLLDCRRESYPVSFTFTGQLKAFQEEALNKILNHDFGTLNAPTGSGKTIIALAAIAARKQPALIVVHTKELLEQWRDRIKSFLGIPAQDIGIIGNGKKTVGETITVALVQSLYKCAAEVSPRIGYLIIDECHRTPSRTFTDAVSAFDCRYMLGLSATPWRRDRLTKLIYLYLGDAVYRIDSAALQDQGHILKAKVVWRSTSFTTALDPSEAYSQVLSELTRDPARNAMIAQDAATEAQHKTCLILSDRKAHCVALADLLRERGIVAPVLTGDTPKADREQIVGELRSGKLKAVCATGQLVGEGFDCPNLEVLFMATPIRFDGRVLQYVGRILRPAPGKGQPRVYDYIDLDVGPIKAAASARRRVYDGSIYNPDLSS